MTEKVVKIISLLILLMVLIIVANICWRCSLEKEPIPLAEGDNKIISTSDIILTGNTAVTTAVTSIAVTVNTEYATKGTGTVGTSDTADTTGTGADLTETGTDTSEVTQIVTSETLTNDYPVGYGAVNTEYAPKNPGNGANNAGSAINTEYAPKPTVTSVTVNNPE